MRFRDLRVSHLQGVIRDADVGDATKGRIKSLFNMMYKYALIHEICDKDYAALFAHKAGKRNKENRHPFKIQKLRACGNGKTSVLWIEFYFACIPVSVPLKCCCLKIKM